MGKGNGKKRAGTAARAAAGPSTADAPFAIPDWPGPWKPWKLSAIVEYPNNPRTHPPAQITLLASMLKRWGPDQPIVVDEAGVILKGHGRKLAALEAGFEEFPVVQRRGLPESEKRAMRLADNQVALLSGWDQGLIKIEAEALKLAGFDIPLLGFPESQLRGWGIAMGTESGADPEAAPEPPKNPVVRKGDLWVLGEHRLLCGDATSESDAAMCVGKAKPNLMVTDAPYGVEYDANWRNEAAEKGLIGYGARAVSVVHNDHRVDWSAAWKLFSGNVAYCWHADRHASEVQDSLQRSKFEIVCQIIWAKPRFVISRGDYHWQHEPCWYSVRKGAKHNWNGGRSQTTLWPIPHAKSETGHSTQKPIECMKRPIENNSRKGEFIYEPFSGSGTTIIACEMTGRRALAIEIDPSYVQVAIERWEKFTGRKAMLDGKTLEQVGTARKKGRPINASGNSRKPVSRQDAGGDGGERRVREGVHAGRTAPRREPAGEPSAVAGDS